MKDEIKEILSLLNSSSWSNEAKQIEDYITNLQERFDALLEAHKIANELETEYQERNEKAIEYMNNYIKVEESNEPVKIEFKVVKTLLQGEDKE